MHQRKYASDILKGFDMRNCNSVKILVDTKCKLTRERDKRAINPAVYKQIMGCLRYLCNTRTGIAMELMWSASSWIIPNILTCQQQKEYGGLFLVPRIKDYYH